MPTSLHLLNARGEFNLVRERIETCFAESMQEIGALLDIHDVDVVAYVSPGRGPGFGSTLLEALISEGLACQFETEISAGEIPFYAQALSPEEMSRLFEQAKPELHSDSYGHAKWFFGNAQTGIPRHTGYSIGFDLVKQFIKQHGGTARQLVHAPAQDFYS